MLTPVCIANRRKENQVREEREQENIEAAAEEVKPGEIESIGAAFCSYLFWIKFLILIFGSCGVFLINGNYKTYVKD